MQEVEGGVSRGGFVGTAVALEPMLCCPHPRLIVGSRAGAGHCDVAQANRLA